LQEFRDDLKIARAEISLSLPSYRGSFTSMMKILLTNPANAGILRAVGVQFPPAGPLYLGSYLEKEGCHVEIKDFCTSGGRGSPDYFTYDLVGISTDTTRHNKAMGIARQAKEAGCTVVMGAPTPVTAMKRSSPAGGWTSSSTEKVR